MLSATSIAVLILLQGGGGGGGIIILLIIIGLAVGGRILYSRSSTNIAAMERIVRANIDPSITGPASALMKRYRDAYLYARVITGIGNFVKNVGIAAGILLFIILFLVGSDRAGPVI